MANPPQGSAFERGIQAETQAMRYLEQQGLVCLERNFRCRAGEIDLIMQDGACRVAVEVRFRSHENYGGALYSIDGRKQRRLLAASRYYLKQRGFSGPFRLDVVAISLASDHQMIFNWIKNAIIAP